MTDDTKNDNVVDFSSFKENLDDDFKDRKKAADTINETTAEFRKKFDVQETTPEDVKRIRDATPKDSFGIPIPPPLPDLAIFDNMDKEQLLIIAKTSMICMEKAIQQLYEHRVQLHMAEEVLRAMMEETPKH
jgi:hypothetical protein